MRQILLALVVIATGLVVLAAQLGVALPPEAGMVATVILIAAGAWLLIDGLLSGRRDAQTADRTGGEVERLRAELETAKRQAAESDPVGLLSLLQQKGRFLDFVMDDVTKYPDAQIGAAARVVHQGCSAVVHEYFDIKPVHDDREGAPLTLEDNYDAHRYRLVGRVTGEPPFRGRVLHRGWLTTSVNLPKPTQPVGAAGGRSIIAPAEVELS